MHTRSFWMALVAISAASVLACGEEGVTPKNCPELPLRGDPDYEAKLRAAVDAGCATAASNAAGTPPPSAEGGAGGDAATAGGAAGSSGS